MVPERRKRQEPQDTVDWGLDLFQRAAAAEGACYVSSDDGDAPGCLPRVVEVDTRQPAIGPSLRRLSFVGDKTNRGASPSFPAQLPSIATSAALSIQWISISDVEGLSYATSTYDELVGAPLLFVPVFDM